jgi:hypothetical protein
MTTTSDLELAYRQRIHQMGELIDTTERLVAWLVANGVGSEVAVLSTLAEHQADIDALKAAQRG